MKKFICFLASIPFLLLSADAQVLKNDAEVINNNSGKLLTDMIDTSTRMGKNMLSLYNKFGQVGFSGYLQPQFQYSQMEGNPNSYRAEPENSNNRFRLRRGRLRADYAHYDADGQPSVYFLFQFDGSERGVNIRDFWGRYYENKWSLFHISMGVMARPFGHEILLSSFYREAPERGRMSQILMQTERDLGVMFSLNPRKSTYKMKWLAIDLGIYNGQGLTGPMEYDSHKDIVFRVSSRRQKIKNTNFRISGGLSGYLGGITNESAELYSMQNTSNGWRMVTDSTASNIGRVAKRQYFGGDIQFIIPNAKGQTEFRAEYVRGLQSGTLDNSTSPGTYPVDGAGNAMPLATRPFDGAYFYFLQHLGSTKHQIVLKYDWYDPNKKVKGAEVSDANNFTAADIRYNTVGAGYMHYVNPYLKFVFWYEYPMNEKTAVAGYENDLTDGIFTARAQFSF